MSAELVKAVRPDGWAHEHGLCRSLAEHGTYAGRSHHYQHCEPACPNCAEAAKTHMRVRRAAKGLRASQLAPCGTEAAYNRHRHRGEPIDEECRRAVARAARTRRAARAKGHTLELAIAQGLTTKQIMDQFGVDYRAVKSARDRMAS
jgi:hypothetical protein